MTCPGCGFKNGEAAQACNLCGKLLIAKAPPPAAAPPPPPKIEAAPPAPVDDRVASWPNRAILCFLFTPALTILIAPLMFHKEEYETSMSSDQVLKIVSMMILAAGNLIATVPLAARLKIAPLAATVASALLLVVSMGIDGRMGGGLLWVTLGGIGLSWADRSAYTRPLEPVKLPGWILRGYRRLLQPDRWAAMRLIGGIVLLMGGIAFMLLFGMTLLGALGLPKSVAKIMAVPAFIGAILAASGLSFSEAPEKT